MCFNAFFWTTEYAALRPRENSASHAAVAAATVTAAAAASSQHGLSDSLSTLQASLGGISMRPVPARKSSQDSGKFECNHL